MLDRVAAVAGTALRGVFSLILQVRRPRPIHPHGLVLTGEATWIDGSEPTGIGWIDDVPAEPRKVRARLSRSVGLPSRMPDVLGLALRFDGDDGDHGGEHVDVLLASTGIGFPSRFLLAPRRSATRATFGSLLPYRSPRGPVLICARSVPPRSIPADIEALRQALRMDPWRVRLYHASPAGKWRPFAELLLRPTPELDSAELRFDPVGHSLPTSVIYPWVRRLREPSYRKAQRET